jgi:hypothetical protein
MRDEYKRFAAALEWRASSLKLTFIFIRSLASTDFRRLSIHSSFILFQVTRTFEHTLSTNLQVQPTKPHPISQ